MFDGIVSFFQNIISLVFLFRKIKNFPGLLGIETATTNVDLLRIYVYYL